MILLCQFFAGCNGPRPNIPKISNYHEAQQALVKGIAEKTLQEIESTGFEDVDQIKGLGKPSKLEDIREFAETHVNQILGKLQENNVYLSDLQQETLVRMATAMCVSINTAATHADNNYIDNIGNGTILDPITDTVMDNFLDVAHDKQSERDGHWVNAQDFRTIIANPDILNPVYKEITKQVGKDAMHHEA